MGIMFAWGWGALGQLGLGNFSSVDAPCKLDITDIVNISAGGTHSGAVDVNGDCFTWGSCTYGQLGLGQSAVAENQLCVPSKVHFGESEVKITKISCGGQHTAAVTIEGGVYCWGRADSGQVGFSDWYKMLFPGVDKPRKLDGMTQPISDVKCGGFHTLLLTCAGDVFSMGKDDFGMLGHGAKEECNLAGDTWKPTLLQSFARDGVKVSGIAAGGWHSCFVSTEGVLYTCGKGEYGRLGTGDERSRDEPTIVGHHVTLISAGGSHSLWVCHSVSSAAVASTSTSSSEAVTVTRDVLYAAGRDDNERLGVTPRVSATAAAALKKESSCLQPQQVDLVSAFLADHPHSRIVDIDAGGSHSTVVVELPGLATDDAYTMFNMEA